jgi:hypothetical protein
MEQPRPPVVRAVSNALPLRQKVAVFDEIEIAGSSTMVNVTIFDVAVLQPDPAVQF